MALLFSSSSGILVSFLWLSLFPVWYLVMYCVLYYLLSLLPFWQKKNSFIPAANTLYEYNTCSPRAKVKPRGREAISKV